MRHSRLVLSPNYGVRLQPVSMLVLHYTGMPSAEAARARLRDPAAEVSAHYLVDEDGRIDLMVAEKHRAWHAGAGFWAGVRDINSASIGVEIVNPGHAYGYCAFPQRQMDAVAELAADVIRRHRILPVNVVGHSDVAPVRKQDPGELFPWAWLAGRGVGVFPQPEFDGSGGVSAELSALLSVYGYDITVPQAAITAFCRHFCPACLTEPDTRTMQAMAAALVAVRHRLTDGE